jgi:hypothetical protein
MQVSRDHLPAAVLMANAMNTSKELDDLQGLVPMLNEDVLRPFAQQSYMCDDLWLEQDGAAHFVVVAKRH